MKIHSIFMKEYEKLSGLGLSSFIVSFSKSHIMKRDLETLSLATEITITMRHL